MHDIHCRYQMKHDDEEISIAGHHWEERREGRIHYIPGLCPLDIDEGIVEQVKSICI